MAQKKPTGRPTKYKPHYETEAFFNEFLDHCKKNHEPPYDAGLACYLNVSRDTIYEWNKVHQGFSDMLKRLKVKAEHAIAMGGLKNKYNPTITKLMLTKHGYSDRQEISGPGGESLRIEIVEEKQ